MREDINEKIKIPEGIIAEITENPKAIKMKGKKGELKRLLNGKFSIRQEGNFLIMENNNSTKNDKRNLMTNKAHIENMIKGLTEGFTYKLKIAHVHFPMTATVEKNELVIKNFLGEKNPRRAKIPFGVDVKVQKDEIIVKAIDKEKAGQTAANFEKATRVKSRDRRIFQDGIYITDKALNSEEQNA